jgi:prophage regulatory protein
VATIASNLMGVAEVAERLGVSRQRVDQLTREHADFPEPVGRLRAGRVWEQAAIEGWIVRHPKRPAGRPSKARGKEGR